MRSVIKKFGDRLMKEKYSGNTIKSYKSLLKQFYDEVRKPFSRVTLSDVDRFLKKKRYNTNSKNTFIAAYNCYCRMYDSEYTLVAYRKRDVISINYIPIDEVEEVLLSINGIDNRLIARLIYGCGFRLHEVLRLRINDIDLKKRVINVNGRSVPIPKCIKKDLIDKMKVVELQHKKDLMHRNGKIYLPDDENSYSIKRKWQFLFFQRLLKKHGGHNIRDYYNKETFQKEIYKATNGEYSPASLRHSYGIHMLQFGISKERLCELMGYANHGMVSVYEIHAGKNGIKFRNDFPINYLEGRYRRKLV